MNTEENEEVVTGEEILIEVPPIVEETETQELLVEVPPVEEVGEVIAEEVKPVKRGRGRPKKNPLAEANAKISEKITPGELLTPKHIKLIRGNYSKRTLKARFGI